MELSDHAPSLRTSDFSYDLPPELIAQEPLKERDASRLLVLDRRTGAVTHDLFRHLGAYLRSGDLLVMNDSRVRPARIWAVKPSGGRLELLILRPTEDGGWETLVKPGRRAAVGTTFTLTDRAGTTGGTPVHGEVVAKEPDGVTRIRVDGPLDPALARLGEMPLPPYIHRRLPAADAERYQTTYAAVTGSAAAPTAGLHFTPALLDHLRTSGIQMATVTLHVGLDTFRPVTEDDPTAHPMHAEWYTASADTAAMICETKRMGSRVVAVGTTSVRVLESVAAQEGGWEAATERGAEGWTRLFIRSGYTFRAVDALITNFHLPRSTLLMLVSAFAGREPILAAYAEAVRERYRFFSFGDACLIR
ncbi:MAG: tRNA preQ1(34) S-adenosylmethionine ribosyltransferase-isomerase QueA [Thermomicrobia bacterium]|nr:tRNA preQ1(34) S-adenosylmethionine ribosyltransferase-isomerase QueA [Thermomicrobia bacterium]